MKDPKEIILEKGIESLEEIQTWLKSGKDFVIEQSPLLIQEIINWGLYESIFYLILNIIIFFISIFLVVKLTPISKFGKNLWEQESSGDLTPEQGMYLVAVILGCIGLIVGFINISIYTHHTIFIGIAPRLYVLQELASLLKN